MLRNSYFPDKHLDTFKSMKKAEKRSEYISKLIMKIVMGIFSISCPWLSILSLFNALIHFDAIDVDALYKPFMQMYVFQVGS